VPGSYSRRRWPPLLRPHGRPGDVHLGLPGPRSRSPDSLLGCHRLRGARDGFRLCRDRCPLICPSRAC